MRPTHRSGHPSRTPTNRARLKLVRRVAVPVCDERSAGEIGAGCAAGYAGEPTTIIRRSGPIGTAIMSLSRLSPADAGVEAVCGNVGSAVDHDLQPEVGIDRKQEQSLGRGSSSPRTRC